MGDLLNIFAQKTTYSLENSLISDIINNIKYLSKRNSMFKKINTILMLIFLFLSISLLNACSDDSASPKLTGTVATGAAGEGKLYITDANGTEINIAITETDKGKYSANVSGMTAPFILGFDQSPEDGINDLYSYSEVSNAKANVTQLTNLAMFLANNETNLKSVYTNWGTSPLDSTKISVAQAKVNANFSAKINAISGLDSTNYNFMTTEFDPDGTGIDKLLDDVTVNISDTNNLTVSVSGDSNFTFNIAIDVSAIRVDTENYDATCSAGWCISISGDLSVNGQSTEIPETRIKSNVPDEEVPTPVSEVALKEAFKEKYGSIGEIRDFDVQLTTNTSTKVVAEVSAKIVTTISEFGQSVNIDSDFTLVFTYTKATP